MKRFIYYTIVIGAGCLLLSGPASAADFNWYITYPTYNTPGGRLLASGDTTAVMKVEFDDINTANSNSLLFFGVRPVTSHTTNWYIRSIQLWQNSDGDNGTLNTSTDTHIDTKLSQNFGNFNLATPQQTPDRRIYFTIPDGSLSLGTNAVFFIALEVTDFETITDQNGVDFGLTILKGSDPDLVVTPPGQSNNWQGDVTKLFEIKAVRLPVTIKNSNPSVEEDEDHYPDENMFFPNFLAADGSVPSVTQQIQDLSFTADVFFDTLLLVDSLTYVDLWIGWNNDILELDTMRHGSAWDDSWDTSSDIGPPYTSTNGSGDSSDFRLVRFEAWVSPIEDPPYVEINNNSIAELDFNVRKPGISPIFIQDITVRDRWGIAYHPYRKIRNQSTNDPYEDGTEYDGWAKFILGDYSGPESSGNLGSGICDGKVQFEDITLFSQYMFMSNSNSDWHDRFDIGAEDFHDPDGLVQPDDTTNFYDLLIFGSNYHRNIKGNFLQKNPAPCNEPLEISVTSVPATGNLQRMKSTVHLDNVRNLLGAHLKIEWDSKSLELISASPGTLIEQVSEQYMFLSPHDPESNAGTDINFVALDKTLSGSGPFLDLTFNVLNRKNHQIRVTHFDPRDESGKRLTYKATEDISSPEIPQDFAVLHNYPNPFNATTRIHYHIPEGMAGVYEVSVYDIVGNKIRTLSGNYHKPGRYSTEWNGRNDTGTEMASGIYFVQLSGNRLLNTTKITLLR